MKKEKILESIGVGIIVPGLVLVVWYICGQLGKLNVNLIPTLNRTLSTAWELIISGDLWEDISVSFVRVFKGFCIGAVSGIILGTLMGLYKPIYGLLNSTVSLLRPIPMMALIPLFILWLGIGESSKVTLIALGSFWSVLLNTIHGIQSVDPKLLEVTTVLEKSPQTVFLRVYLPSALPAIITGLRLGIGSAWTCVISAEMMAASKGIGYMLMFARELSRPDELMVGVFTIGIIGLLIDKGLLCLQKKILWWQGDMKED